MNRFASPKRRNFTDAPAQWLVALFRERRFARFLLVGAVNTLFGYGVFFMALSLTGHAILSAAISTAIGVLFNFRSIGVFVFQSSDNGRLLRFVLVYAAVFAANAAGLGALQWLGVPAAAAQACLLPALAGMSYLFNRAFVFGAPPREGAPS
jgi:putative flippase GtrA